MTQCDRTGCEWPAELRPSLVLKAGPAVTPLVARLDIVLCSECARDAEVEHFVTDEGWQQLLDALKAKGLVPPRRELTEVIFDEVDDELTDEPEGKTA